ncbi:MAG TPA: T9SS type A sorting domain-containing protein [Bacteroidia bacterium]|nr:T9SS type A sorting domain-containing protein [Bacteroidia bacterium]
MNTKQIIMSAMLISASLLNAQTKDQPATVRMKKTVVINGVEKTTDTTFTTNNPSAMELEGGNVNIQEIRDENGKIKRIVTVNNEIETDKDGRIIHKTVVGNPDPGKDGKMIIIKNGHKLSPEDEAKIKALGDEMAQSLITAEDSKNSGSLPKEDQQVIIKKVRCGATSSETDSIKEYTTIVIVKKVNIVNPSDEELKLLGRQTGISDKQLAMDKLRFYPNPNNGKFNLAFSLAKKANTEISIFNIEGKTIYSEKLVDFQGNYDKEIDISQNPKGNYFIKIAQGDNSQVKKIVIE